MPEISHEYSSGLTCRPMGRHSLQSLESDVLILICESLSMIYPQALRVLGATCRRLYQFTVAFNYRTIHLKPKLLASPMSPSLERFWEKMHCHTRHISIMEELDWDMVIPLVSECQMLSVIDWGVWGERDGCQSPETSRIPRLLQDIWPRADLRLINYPWPSKVWYNMYTYTLPTENIVYISTQALKNKKRDFEPLGKLISNSPKLKVLHLESMCGDGLWTKIRVPPIRELVMRECTWTFTPEEVGVVWDFSQLQILEVNVIDCAKEFLDSVPGGSLKGLRKLIVTGKHDVRWGESCSRQLNDLISRSHLLEALEIDCELPLLRIESVYKHTDLRTVKIQDFRGFGNEKIVCPTLTVRGVAGLLDACPRLRHLSLDLDQTTCEVEDFLRLLARFRNLQYLKLRMRSLLHELGENSTSVDADLEAAKRHASLLGSEKEGLPMISLTFCIAGYNESTNRSTPEWQ
ncbi:hypothetical protein DL98DRAFT_590612 [Cadophora sp. DSE1049]|nr:hypothetical protein DL98DRAFT_590612 [Cadophora sp. DSE1049]